MSEKIIIFDTTLRDGEQSPGASLNAKEKLEIARHLEMLNVDVIEAGFPFASKGDLEAVRAVAREIRRPQIAALARAKKEDIDAAWEAIKEAANPRIHTFISTSDIHLKYQMKKTREQVLEEAVAAVRYAARYTSNVEFSAMDASRSDLDYVVQVFTAVIDAGATTVNFPDTVGYAVPEEFGAKIKYLLENIPNIHKAVLSVHCHNDLGLAVANSLAAIRNGARQVECTINGIGERAGNTSLEEVVMALATRKDFFRDYHTDIVTQYIYPTSRLVSKLTGMVVQPNKAIVGANAFAHESGIHQDAVLKEASTFEIMTPQSIGIKASTLPLGKLSGRHALRAKLQEMGYNLSEEDLNRVFVRFKDLADRKKKVYDEDLESIVETEVLRQSVPEYYKLVELVVLTGTMAKPTATVKLEIGGEVVRHSSFGDGPIDATYNAIAHLTKTQCKLLKFSVSSITGGTDALGEITVKLEEDGKTVTGRGVDPDIVTASARAFLNGLNRLYYLKQQAAANAKGQESQERQAAS